MLVILGLLRQEWRFRQLRLVSTRLLVGSVIQVTGVAFNMTDPERVSEKANFTASEGRFRLISPSREYGSVAPSSRLAKVNRSSALGGRLFRTLER